MNPKSVIPSPSSFSGLHVCSHFAQQILFFDSTPPHKNFLSIHIVILVLLSLFIMLIKKCYINYCLPHQIPFAKSYYFCNKKVSLRDKKRWFLILRESNSKWLKNYRDQNLKLIYLWPLICLNQTNKLFFFSNFLIGILKAEASQIDRQTPTR